MELDPIQLLCSGNPLDVLIAELKKQLAAAIKDAAGKVNAAITALSDTLKAALQSLIPELPTKPSFLVDLLALKSKIEGDVAEFKEAAAALVEKWGKAVSGILTLIENLANITICDLLTLNFKMNPDGSISLESAPPKTPSGAPEKPVPAESTVENNLPENYVEKNDAAVSANADVYETIKNTKAGKAQEAAIKAEADITKNPTYRSLLAKAESQNRSQIDESLTGLTAAETQIREEYVGILQQKDATAMAVGALALAADRSIAQLSQIVKSPDPAKQGKISSEAVESIISNFPNEVAKLFKEEGIRTEGPIAGTESVKAVQDALRKQWKPIVEKQAQNSGINTVEVIAGEDFTAWFDKQGFRNFTADQFTSYFARNLNTVPPQSLWANIVATLRIVDDLADTLGARISITSSYRSSAYNRSVGGAANSFHSKFNALDIQVSGVAPSRVFAQLKAWRNQNRFKGGLGLYPSFVHVDTRGYNSNW